MGPNSHISHLTVMRGLRRAELGEGVYMGRLNWITGLPTDDEEFFQSAKGRDPSLYIGREAAVTHRHIIDCSDSVTIGELSLIAGFRSVLLTHGIDIRKNAQSANPIVIGDRCLVGSNSVLIGGAVLPPRSSLGAGSMLRGANEEPGLYSGVPAVRVGDLPEDAEFFHRKTGIVY